MFLKRQQKRRKMPARDDLIVNPLSGQRATRLAVEMRQSYERIDRTFRELAIRETLPIDDKMAEMLAAKVQEVKAHRSDLTDLEAYAVAGRLLRQLILCYKSALDQLLP